MRYPVMLAAMEIPSLKLHNEEFEKIELVLASLLERFAAAAVFLISRSGQELAFQGDLDAQDRDVISSLAAGNLAATFGLAQLLGEVEFDRVFHCGRVRSLFMSPVGQLAFLLMVLPNRPRDRNAFRGLGRSVLLLRDLLERRNPPLVETCVAADSEGSLE